MRIALFALLFPLAACGGKSTPAPAPVAEPPPRIEPVVAAPVVKAPPTLEEKLALQEACFEAFLAEDPGFFDRCYAAGATDEIVDGGPPAEGIDGIRANTQPFWDAVTLEGEIRLNLVQGDQLLSIQAVRGINDGEMMGMPATGKPFGLLMAAFTTLDEDGRSTGVRSYMDLGSFMAQLGAAPKGTPHRAAVALTGAPAETIVADDGETEASNADVVRAGFLHFNDRNWKGLVALYAADGVLSDQTMPADVKGAKALDKLFKELSKAFPDAQQEVVSVWAAGDYVVAETIFSGTNKAAAPGMGIKKATKKPVSLRTAHVFLLADGKVQHHWLFANGAAMAAQLGLLGPAPGKK